MGLSFVILVKKKGEIKRENKKKQKVQNQSEMKTSKELCHENIAL